MSLWPGIGLNAAESDRIECMVGEWCMGAESMSERVLLIGACLEYPVRTVLLGLWLTYVAGATDEGRYIL